MNDSNNIILALLGLLVAAALFIGIITMINKSFNTQPKSEKINSTTIKTQQRRLAEDVRERQKELRRNQRQKMRDYRQR